MSVGTADVMRRAIALTRHQLSSQRTAEEGSPSTHKNLSGGAKAAPAKTTRQKARSQAK